MTLNRTEISDRAALRISGPEAEGFLQNILSGNMTGLAPGTPAYSLLLSPQGKVLFDLIAWRTEQGFVIEVEKHRSRELEKKFQLYKLRADIDMHPEELTVTCLWGAIGAELGKTYRFDPRHESLGLRIPSLEIFPAVTCDTTPATPEAYKNLRISCKIPQGGEEIPADAAFPMEYGLLAGIDFTKGCYVGQEVTSRTYRRGKIRKSLHLCTADARFNCRDEIRIGDRQVGEICIWQDGRGLAVLREDCLGEKLTVQGRDLAVSREST